MRGVTYEAFSQESFSLRDWWAAGAADAAVDDARPVVPEHERADAIRRALKGDVPDLLLMAGAAVLSLLVNATVLRRLTRFRTGEVDLRASRILTRADVIANIGVMIAALLVAATASRTPDLVVGSAIGAYVIKEAWEILRDARRE